MPWDIERFLKATLKWEGGEWNVFMECGPWTKVPHDAKFRDVIGDFGIRVMENGLDGHDTNLRSVYTYAEWLATVRNEPVKLVTTYSADRKGSRYPVGTFSPLRRNNPALKDGRDMIGQTLSSLAADNVILVAEEWRRELSRGVYPEIFGRWVLRYAKQLYPSLHEEAFIPARVLLEAYNVVFPAPKVVAPPVPEAELLEID